MRESMQGKLGQGRRNHKSGNADGVYRRDSPRDSIENVTTPRLTPRLSKSLPLVRIC
jgi:hypothetical protein